MSSPLTHLTDFPDRISPMLVKELRQGLRAKTFIAVFLSLQIFLAVMLFSAGAASTSDHVGSVVSGIIFTFFALAVLVVQPLRGTGALSSEAKGNTIDMMVLTRLSASRIVMGKWVAIVSQSALLLSTIVPYLILRYFFGGMNLVAELVLLALVFITSMGLTAVTVGLSGCNSMIIRALLPMLGLPILAWTLLIMTISSAFGGGDMMDAFTLDSTESRVGVSFYVASVAYLGASMLSLGASLIAPAAENHSLVRRLVATGLLAALWFAGFHDKAEGWLVALAVVVVAAPAMIIAFCDSAPLVPTVSEPFVRRGPLGRLCGAFLYPTWPSGLLAGIVIGLLGLASVATHALIRSGGYGLDNEETIATLAIFGGLVFPAVWQAFFFKGEGQRLAHYLLLLVGSGVLCAVLTGLADSMNSGGFLWFFAWHPLAFLAMIEESSTTDTTMLMAVVLVDLALLGILLVSALIGLLKSSATLEAGDSGEPPAP